MSAQIDRIYKLAFRRHFTNYEGNFPPNRQLMLGDYGVMSSGYFSRLGNVSDMGIEFEMREDQSPAYETFKSTGSTSFNSVAKGDVLPTGAAAAKASVDIGFTETKAVFFSSALVRYNEIKDIAGIGERILDLFRAGKWKKEYFLVTRLIEGKNAIVVISGSATCTVTIEARADVPRVDLANADVEFAFKNVQQTAYEVIINDACQLGMGLSRIYDTFFIKPKFKATVSELFTALDHNDNATQVTFGDVQPPPIEDLA